MRNELIKDLELAKEMKLPVTAMNLDCVMKVGVGEIYSINETEDGHSFIIKGEEFYVDCTDRVDCVMNGGKKYYRLNNANFAEWELIIIL